MAQPDSAARFSLLELVQPATPIRIVDVGASLTEEPPYKRLLDAGAASVIGFEPDPEQCARLNERADARQRYLPHFVADGHERTYYQTNWFATGSLLRPNEALLRLYNNMHEAMTLVAEHRVATVALDDLPETAEADLLKIDVQGAELMVFRGAGRILSSAPVVHTEVEFVPLYEHQPLYGDVAAALAAHAYSMSRFLNFGTRNLKPLVMNANPNTGLQMLWGDALFVKHLTRLSALSDDKLAKLAVIMHDLYGTLDVAYAALAIIDQRHGRSVARDYIVRCGGDGA